MSKRLRKGWMNGILRQLPSATVRKSASKRLVQLEQLEPRYALDAAPTAGNDNYFGQYADVPNSVQMLVMNNDSDVDTLPSVLRVGEVNGAAVPVSVGTPFTYVLPHGSLTLRANHQIFDYTPALGYTGLDGFTYRTADGPDPGNPGDLVDLSNEATVTVNVRPVTDIGDDVVSSINEGSGLHLDDLDDDLLSQTSAPGPVTYKWYVDANEADISPFSGTYVPNASDLVNGPAGSATAALDLDWADLNAPGIDIVSGINGQDFPPIITLEVIDGNGQQAFSHRFLSVHDVVPEPTSFTVVESSSGPCGGSTVTLEATFTEPNPLETNFTVSVDWNWDLFHPTTPEPSPTPDQTLTYVNNNNGTFTVTATVHDYGAAGIYLPILFIEGHGEGVGQTWFLSSGDENPAFPGLPIFVDVAGGGAPTPPTVDIVGEPASSSEGTTIGLTSIVTQSCGTNLAYAWSVTKNGDPYATGTPADGAAFNFTPDDDGTYVVSLTATGDGGPTTESVTINVTNLAPSLGSLTITQPVGGGPAVTIDGSFTDPGIGDTFNVHIVWESGATSDIPVAASATGSHTFTANYTYTSTGDKPISVTVTDDNTGAAAGSASVTIQAALSPSGALSVLGSTGGENVTLSTPSAGTIRVQGDMLGGPVDFPAGSVTSIQVDLGSGNDMLFVGSGITAPLVVFGGAGNDVVASNGGPTVLVGGDGTDTLLGGAGRNILIGGADSDILSGGGGQDILIDSGTIHDNNAVALLAMLAEWNSSHTLQNRILNLTNGSGSQAGLNGSFFLTTTGNDLAVDLLIGGGGTDWILLHAGDLSLGLGDIINQL